MTKFNLPRKCQFIALVILFNKLINNIFSEAKIGVKSMNRMWTNHISNIAIFINENGSRKYQTEKAQIMKSNSINKFFHFYFNSQGCMSEKLVADFNVLCHTHFGAKR